ncbi:MAG TPA: GtrA family protein [Micromonosporaceae bacterium]|jgi:putative flippase GtrA
MKPIRALLDRDSRLFRMLRYSLASVLASLVSFVTIALVLSGLGFNSVVATISGFCAGALVAFVVNRFWTWQLRDATGVGGQLVRYWVVAIVTFLIALGCTTIADHYARGIDPGTLVRTLIVEGAYFGSYAVTFVAKYVLLDRFVFVTPDRAERSRDQVENTTRA